MHEKARRLAGFVLLRGKGQSAFDDQILTWFQAMVAVQAIQALQFINRGLKLLGDGIQGIP